MTDNGAKALAERIGEAWAEQTPETGWLDDAHQPLAGVVAAAILANGAVFLTAEEAERLTEQRDRAWSNLDMAHDDIAALLRASGLGDNARPVSTHDVMQWELLPAIERLRRIEAAARRREEAEERYADAETAYNESHKPTFTRKFLQIDRLATERAEAVLALRAALTGAPDGREPDGL